jgi:hypothetical protein
MKFIGLQKAPKSTNGTKETLEAPPNQQNER